MSTLRIAVAELYTYSEQLTQQDSASLGLSARRETNGSCEELLVSVASEEFEEAAASGKFKLAAWKLRAVLSGARRLGRRAEGSRSKLVKQLKELMEFPSGA